KIASILALAPRIELGRRKGGRAWGWQPGWQQGMMSCTWHHLARRAGAAADSRQMYLSRGSATVSCQPSPFFALSSDHPSTVLIGWSLVRAANTAVNKRGRSEGYGAVTASCCFAQRAPVQSRGVRLALASARGRGDDPCDRVQRCLTDLRPYMIYFGPCPDHHKSTLASHIINGHNTDTDKRTSTSTQGHWRSKPPLVYPTP
ncbi:hypothetical protein MAPG_06529, partial [Magnaporthiopsis poae ATCC 64411]